MPDVRERTFRQRNRRITLREVTDLIAVREGAGAARSEGGAAESLPPDVPLSQVRALEDSGWVLRERAQDATRADLPRASIFVSPNGRLLLGTDRLTVKLTADPTEEDARAILGAFGVRITRRLRFAPGLFEVTLTDSAQGDALDVANRLVDSDRVEFAEPIFREQLGPR